MRLAPPSADRFNSLNGQVQLHLTVRRVYFASRRPRLVSAPASRAASRNRRPRTWLSTVTLLLTVRYAPLLSCSSLRVVFAVCSNGPRAPEQRIFAPPILRLNHRTSA